MVVVDVLSGMHSVVCLLAVRRCSRGGSTRVSGFCPLASTQGAATGAVVRVRRAAVGRTTALLAA